METPANELSTAELVSHLIKPANPTDLMVNIKWMMDNDLLLREDFYTEENLKLFSGAQALEEVIHDTSVKDRPRHWRRFNFTGFEIAPKVTINKVALSSTSMRLSRDYHGERLVKANLHWRQRQTDQPGLLIEQIEQILGRPDRLYFNHQIHQHNRRYAPSTHREGNNTAEYRIRLPGITRSISFELHANGTYSDGAFVVERDPVGYVLPHENERPFDCLTVIPIPCGGFSLYAHDNVVDELLAALRASDKLSVESVEQSDKTYVPAGFKKNHYLVIQSTQADLHAALLSWADNWRIDNGMYTFAAYTWNEREQEIRRKFNDDCLQGNPLSSTVGRRVECFFMDDSHRNVLILGLRDCGEKDDYFVDMAEPDGSLPQTVKWSNIRKFVYQAEFGIYSYTKEPINPVTGAAQFTIRAEVIKNPFHDPTKKSKRARALDAAAEKNRGSKSI